MNTRTHIHSFLGKEVDHGLLLIWMDGSDNAHRSSCSSSKKGSTKKKFVEARWEFRIAFVTISPHPGRVLCLSGTGFDNPCHTSDARLVLLCCPEIHRNLIGKTYNMMLFLKSGFLYNLYYEVLVRTCLYPENIIVR
jgi:hypothetical protein